MIGRRWGAAVAGLTLGIGVTTALAKGEKRDKLKDELNDRVELAGTWVYDDVEKGFAEAKAGGKPLLFVFR